MAKAHRVFQETRPTDGKPPGDIQGREQERVLRNAGDGYGGAQATVATFQKFPPWLFKPPSGQDFLELADGLALPAIIGAQVQGPIIRLPSQYIGRFAAATIFVDAPTTALLIDFVLRINGAPVPGWTMQTFARAATNLSIDFEGRVDMPQSAVMDIVIINRAAVAFTVGAQITGWSWPATTLEA
ncbi:MAG: hypothetical protein GY906_38645 [bacterium]|nr:hypothetical protein [bacterium]